MSVTYSLHRVKRPLAERPLTMEECGGEDFLPFGPADTIARRLMTALEQLGPVRRENHAGGPLLDPITGEPIVLGGKARVLPPRVTLTLAAIGSTALFLNARALTRRSLPALDDEEQVLALAGGWGFEGFLARLTDDIVVVGVPTDGEDGYSIHGFQGPELRPLYELPIEAAPSAPVAVSPDTWGCLLRPLRQHRDREAEVILVATRTGEILHRELLGCRGWYPGHVAGGDGWLCATTQRSTNERIVSGIRAYRVGAGLQS